MIEERLRKSLIILKKEHVTAQLQVAISKDVEQKLNQRQRKYFLTEQLESIKKELGLDSDSKEKTTGTHSDKRPHRFPSLRTSRSFLMRKLRSWPLWSPQAPNSM